MRSVAVVVLAAASLASACSSTVSSRAAPEATATNSAPGPTSTAAASTTTADGTTSAASESGATTTTTGKASTAVTAPAPTDPPAPIPSDPAEPESIRAPVTTTTPPPVWPKTISIAVTGDTLPHSPLWRQAARNATAAGDVGHDFAPMLAGLAPLLGSVDLTVCHLETPIAPEGEEYTTMPFYGVPAEIATALAAAGYDRCSTASNHTADRGAGGIDRTVEVLEANGLGQSGMAREHAEIRPRLFDVGDVRVSHLSYTWSYNGLSLPAGEEWRSALIDPERIVREARIARQMGAEVVLVSLHWGAEGIHEPTRYQRAVAEEITASGAIDLVVGHHAHVLQPIEQVNGTWVLFGLGNILSNLPTSDRWPAASQDAAVVTVTMTIDEDGEVAVERPVVHPTWVDKDAGWIVRLVQDELAGEELSAGRRGQLEASLERTRRVVGGFLAGT